MKTVNFGSVENKIKEEMKEDKSNSSRVIVVKNDDTLSET